MVGGGGDGGGGGKPRDLRLRLIPWEKGAGNALVQNDYPGQHFHPLHHPREHRYRSYSSIANLHHVNLVSKFLDLGPVIKDLGVLCSAL